MVRYLISADHHPARITKTDKDFAKELDFKDMKFPVKVRDILKIEKKKISITISVSGYKNEKNMQFMYHKNAVNRNMLIYY